MSKRSKFFYVLFVLLFAVTSLAGGAFAAVQMAAHDMGFTNSAFHMNDSVGSPAYSIAGECDMASGCGFGSG